MQLDIRSQGLDISQGLRGQIERRLRFVLGRFVNRVSRVTVHLADLNGPRGGIDKRCRVVVRLLRSGQVFVEDVDADLEAVVDRATDRVRQSVRRVLERRRERRGRWQNGEDMPAGDPEARDTG